MNPTKRPDHFVFPRWTNALVLFIVIGVAGSLPYLVVLAGTGLAPRTLAVGYQPLQPIPYSHELHVTKLGLDCRYCHDTVENAAFAAIPPASTCMNCHHAIYKNSPKLQPLRDAYETGKPIAWVKVHDLADYSYFNHSVHVNAGVGCIECHGRVDRMGEQGVRQQHDLSMGWCLKCHRHPEPYLRPVDNVTQMDWGLERTEHDKLQEGQTLSERQNIYNARQLANCSACHR